MSPSALATLRDLGTPEELRTWAARGLGATARVAANTHVHLPPNFSAFASIEDAVASAAREGLAVLGASNYYDYAVYEDLAREGRRYGVFPIFGLEIVAVEAALRAAGIKVNDPGNPGRFYVCGKAVTRFAPVAPEAEVTLRLIRDQNRRRIDELITRLDTLFASAGVSLRLGHEAIAASVTGGRPAARASANLQERHVAQAFQQALFDRVAPGSRLDVLGRLAPQPLATADPTDAAGIQLDLRNLMKAGRPAHVEDTPIDLPLALELVRTMGGIPCYPLLADGAPEVSAFEHDPAALGHKLRELGIHAVEVIPSRNAASVLDRYVLELRQQGFVVTAGTEHNTPARLPLSPSPRSGCLSAAVARVFEEGAAVLLAHQFLDAHGHQGYLDATGSPNPALGNDEQRIRAMDQLGRAVLARYLERYRTEARSHGRDAHP